MNDDIQDIHHKADSVIREYQAHNPSLVVTAWISALKLLGIIVVALTMIVVELRSEGSDSMVEEPDDSDGDPSALTPLPHRRRRRRRSVS